MSSYLENYRGLARLAHIREIRVPHAPVPQGENGRVLVGVNEDPDEMWKRLRDGNALLARLRAVDIGAGELVRWDGIFPLRQYAPFDGASNVHYMIAPRIEADESLPPEQRPANRFLDVKDLPVEALEPAAEVILAHLTSPHQEHEIVAAGVNFSEDPDGRQQKSRSWLDLHFHLAKLDRRVLEQAPVKRGVWEPLAYLMQQVTTAHFQAELRTLSEQQDPVLPYGSMTLVAPTKVDFGVELRPETVLLRYEEFPTPQALAQSMNFIDQSYRALHAKVYDLFTSNLQDVAGSGWRIPYTLRPVEEVEERLVTEEAAALFPNETVRASLLAFHRRLVEGYTKFEPSTSPTFGEEKERKKFESRLIYRSPTSSWTWMMQGGKLYVALCPHLFGNAGIGQPAGSMETLGWHPHREEEPELNTTGVVDYTREQVRRTLEPLIDEAVVSTERGRSL